MIEDILRADPHVVLLEPGEQWEFREIDFSRFPARDIEDARDAVQFIREELSSPYILDDFTNDVRRYHWKCRIAEENPEVNVHSYFQSNSLRLGYISGLRSNVAFLAEVYAGSNKAQVLDVYQSIAEKIRVKASSAPVYDQMVNGKKLEFVKGLKRNVYDLLHLLAAGD